MSVTTVDRVRRALGDRPLTSAWVEVDQEAMNAFGRVTHDDDWMHTDPARARQEGLDGTIAFGFWTLSLLTRFLRDAVGSEYPAGARLGFNYGLDRVRFIAPLPVGGRVRGRLTVTGVREKEPGRVLVSFHAEAEAEGRVDPVMVADWLILLVFDP